MRYRTQIIVYIWMCSNILGLVLGVIATDLLKGNYLYIAFGMIQILGCILFLYGTSIKFKTAGWWILLTNLILYALFILYGLIAAIDSISHKTFALLFLAPIYYFSFWIFMTDAPWKWREYTEPGITAIKSGT